MKGCSWRRLLGLAGAVLTGSAGMLTTAAPAAAGETQTVGVEAQSWYIAPVSTCPRPVGCPPVPVPEPEPLSASPYPKGTLHIEVEGGQPTAHAYVKPDLSVIPFGASMLSGTMTLPVTQDLPLGTARADTASIVGCLVTEPITDGVEGGITQPPAFDCDQASAPAKIRKDGTSFVLDLTPFATAWAAGVPPLGIALVPAPDQQPDANWQVTLNGKGSEATPRIAATISYAPGKLTAGPAAPPPVPPEPEAAPVPALDTASLAAGVPEIGAPPQVATMPATSGPAPAPAPAVVPEPPRVAARLVYSHWYAYGGVVYLPLILLAVGVIVARSLTRPLTPRPLRGSPTT